MIQRYLLPMCILILCIGLLIAPTSQSHAQNNTPQVYKLTIDKEQTLLRPREVDGKQQFFYTVPFQIHRVADQAIDISVPKEQIVVLEDGKRITDFELFQPRFNKLTTIMAIDMSGSMAQKSLMSNRTKMDEAKDAGRLFLDRLDKRADTGLILFDHELKRVVPPAEATEEFQANRERIRQFINQATPQKGGTAYLDATHRAVQLLKEIKGRKAIVVMTDGVDVDSKHKLEEVAKAAQIAEIPVYTIGVGDPVPQREVNSVLVLDKSGSMGEKASIEDERTKIEALKEAASRFVDLMGHNAQATITPFSDFIEIPGAFTNRKDALKRRIESLNSQGGTKLFDATFEGIETLMASQLKGHRYVIVLTDGRDESPGSNRSVDMVIQHAKDKEIPLYMLGLGDQSNINEEVMKRMAQETHGRYFHARNQQKLYEVFETVSTLLHGEGIDEAALRQLATETGGKYHRAKNAEELDFIYTQLADELQTTYTVTFPSRYSQQDGTVAGIDIYVERNGQIISNLGQADLARSGLVVAEMHYLIYLILFGILLILLAVPNGIRRIYRFYGGGGPQSS